MKKIFSILICLVIVVSFATQPIKASANTGVSAQNEQLVQLLTEALAKLQSWSLNVTKGGASKNANTAVTITEKSGVPKLTITNGSTLNKDREIVVSFMYLPVDSQVWLVNAKTKKVYEAQSTMISGGGGGSTIIPIPADIRPGNYQLRVSDYNDQSDIFAQTKKFKISKSRVNVETSNDSAAPSLTVKASPRKIISGQSTTLTWSSKNANRCGLQYGSTEENISTRGTKTVTPSQSTTYYVWCTNDPGTGKDGLSIRKSVSVDVTYPQQGFDDSEELRVTVSSLYTNPDMPFNISGVASESFDEITVALVDVAYAGDKDWNSIGNLMKDGSEYQGVSKTVSTVGTGKWIASFGGLPEGYYHVLIYDAEHNLLGTGFMVSTWKG